MTFKKSHLRNLLIVFILAGLGYGGYTFMQNRPVTVDVAAPSDNVPIRVFGLGSVEARVLSKVGFEVSGTVVELNADHANKVAHASVLARLNVSEQLARVDQADATRLAAEMNIEKARANVDRARAVFDQRKEDSERKKNLVNRNAISQQEASEAVLIEKVAAADLSVAESEVNVTKAQLTDAAAKLRFEKTILEQHVLRAPYDAVIIERHKEAGSVINAGEVIFTLVDPQSIWTLAYVDEEQAGMLALGQAVQIRKRSQPNKLATGKVVRIGLESDRANEERKVWIKCDICPEQPFIGEQAEVWITVATLKDALMVPRAAIHDLAGQKGKVWLVENGVLRQAELTFGFRSEDARHQVVDGLPEGAQIVTTVGPGLRDGRSAKIRQAAK